jgi:hypothetical protein
MTPVQAEGETSLDLIAVRKEQAAEEANREHCLETGAAIAHYSFGVAGVAGGAIAASTASGGAPEWIPIVSGVLAAVGSGLLAQFRFAERSTQRANRAVALKAVADFAENEHVRVRALAATDDAALAALAEVQRRLDLARKGASPES